MSESLHDLELLIENDYSKKGYEFNENHKVKVYGHFVTNIYLPIIDVMLKAKRKCGDQLTAEEVIAAAIYRIQLLYETNKDTNGQTFNLVNKTSKGLDTLYYSVLNYEAKIQSDNILNKINDYYPNDNYFVADKISGAFTEVFGKTFRRFLNELKYK